MRPPGPLRSGLALVCVAVVTAGCAGPAKVADTARPSSSSVPSPTPSPIARYAEPTNACAQLPASVRRSLDVTSGKKSSTSDCKFELGDDRYSSLTVHVQYEVFVQPRLSGVTYGVHKDIALRGKGINTQVAKGGELTAVGAARAGTDYEEAYFAYSTVEMAGLTQGWLYTGYRKGNMVIGIDVSGHRLIPPYSGVLRSKPRTYAALKKVLDAVAAPLLAAAKPA